MGEKGWEKGDGHQCRCRGELAKDPGGPLALGDNRALGRTGTGAVRAEATRWL